MMKRALGLTLLGDRYPALNGLRFIAILSVLQVHVSVVLAGRGLLRDIDIYGPSVKAWFGMDQFFVLSGFLIVSLLLHRKQTDRIGRFYLRRALRTFPLYYVVLTTLILLYPRAAATPGSIAREYLYLTNYTPLPRVNMAWAWSLCVEEHFYFLAPFLVALLAKIPSPKRRIALLAVLALTGIVVRIWTVRSATFRWNDELLLTHVYVRTHCRYDPLLAGMAIAYAQHAYEKELQRFFARFAARAVCYAVFIACVVWLMQPVATRGPNFHLLSWGTVTSIMYVALMLPLLNYSGIRARFLGARVFLWGSTLGYGMYLIHIPLCEQVVAPFAKSLARARWSQGEVWCSSFALLVALSVFGAYVLHLVIEKPSFWLRQRVAP
jgi:peptidoglycan/LPS O-acetylase OafA/YrhL